MNISSSVAPYSPLASTSNNQRLDRSEPQEKTPPQQAPAAAPEKASSQLSTEQLRSVEKPNAAEKQNRTARENERQDKSTNAQPEKPAQSAESEAVELRPVVIEQTNSPATQAFLDVASPRDDFQIVDLYV